MKRSRVRFAPMGAFILSWGRCGRCRRKLKDYRVKATRSDGQVFYFCLGCASQVGAIG
jgi:hypothetical protein